VTAPAAAVGAQAKLNLFLHVLAREDTGYHQLETLFCRLALADEVVVRVTERGRTLDCDAADVGPAQHNLAYRAAATYADRRGWPRGFAIELTKRIPVGAGLGGGSADAGAVLRALRALDPAPPSASTILNWGAELGADVVALALEAPLALAWGRGDRVLPLPALPSCDVALYVPAIRVSTADAYGWIDAARTADPPTGRGGRALDATALGSWEALAPFISNDFEPIVAARHPAIARAAEQLRALPGALATALSGSGSAVFCVLGGRPPAPWPFAVPTSDAVIATTTAEHVVGVRPIE
jgi:4-diphosphocytidyl-2-C-methyl-D-erythritol kinase